MFRKYILLFPFVIVACSLFGAVQPKITTVKFGLNSQLLFNATSGLYSIKYGATLIVIDASATYAIGNNKYSTSDYINRAVKLENINDKVGAGKLLTITSIKAGIPSMIQLFYCYRDRDFVITELEIQGKDLSSNYMAPLISTKANLPIATKLQTLFIPFDNDTFIKYQSKELNEEPNISSEVGVIYDAQSRNGLVLGSLTQSDWKSGVQSAGTSKQIADLKVWGGLNDVNITRDSMAHGSLKGNKIKSPKMFIGFFNDWRTGLEAYAKTSGAIEGRYIKPWGKATPVGWNSWGVIGDKLTYEKATGVVDFFDKQMPAFRNADGTAYIDLDSYWDNIVKGGLRGDFSKLKDFVNYCNERNLQPGVYWAPFIDWGFKSTNKERKAEGGDYTFADMWTKTDKGYHDLDGGRALDPTHPGTKARIAFVLGKLKDCGFKMIKIDFLGHGAIESTRFYDPSINTGMQAYKVGMETVDNALDNSMLVYAAISPSMATVPYVHMRRIACDAFKSIKDTEYTLNSVTYGWWQTLLYDYIDADHLVFEKESIGANRARLISGLISGPVILGDDYSKNELWQRQIKQWLQYSEIKQLIRSGKAFTPVDGGESVSQTFIRKGADGIYLAVFNYQKQPTNVRIDITRLGLSRGKKYNLTELLGAKPMSCINLVEVPFNQEGAYLYKIVAK